jgi:hypothetical protein
VVIALLNPRVWIGLVIAAALVFSHFFVYRAGANNVRLEWKASVAAANTEAVRLERARQRNVDDAGRAAAARESGLRAASRRAAGELAGLRADLDAAGRVASQSIAAADERANAYGKLLVQSGELLTEHAASCDRHVNDKRLLIESWPH